WPTQPDVSSPIGSMSLFSPKWQFAVDLGKKPTSRITLLSRHRVPRLWIILWVAGGQFLNPLCILKVYAWALHRPVKGKNDPAMPEPSRRHGQQKASPTS